MTIELDPNRQKALEDAARRQGRKPQELLCEAVDRFLADSEQPGHKMSAGDPAYEPSKSELGERLRTLRRKYIEGGGRLCSVDEINVEVAEGRGEHEDVP